MLPRFSKGFLSLLFSIAFIPHQAGASEANALNSVNAVSEATSSSCEWHFASHQLCANLVALEIAPYGQESSFEFTVTDPSGNPVEVNALFVDLWMGMGGHGHGSRPVVVEKAGVSHYRVSKVYFVMGGMWDLRVTLDPQTPQAEMAVMKVNAPHGHGPY